MNRILLYSFLILLFLNNYAQEYIPFPTTNAVWTIGGWGVPDNGGYYKYAYVMGGDTIINNKEFKKIWHYSPHIDGTYSFSFAAGIIEEDKKIYCARGYDAELFCIVFAIEDTTILLYDFNVNVGDTIHYFDQVGCWDDIVEDIGSELYYDLNRKYYQMLKLNTGEHKVYE